MLTGTAKLSVLSLSKGMNIMRKLLFSLLICSGCCLQAAELRFAGVLGNSGGSGDTLAAFSGKLASGMGPVLDDSGTIWERGGATQLNRYALDGRMLATFPLPNSTSPRDQLTLAGGVLLLKINKSLHKLAVDAPPGTRPERVNVPLAEISSSSFKGRVAITHESELYWLDPLTDERESIGRAPEGLSALHVTGDGTIFGFAQGKVHAWKEGKPLPGYPKPFRGERPQRIGKWWYAHTWHGTIHRFNANFEPEPGVVLGGASGSFIGYLPRSVDITNGRGLVHIRDNLFAVSGLQGVVQLLQWNDENSRFSVVRRIGPIYGLRSIALDNEGNIWTHRGSWRWTDSPETPHTLGDVEPQQHAQPVVLEGHSLCLLKKHYQWVQLARGRFIDANGWAHLERKGVPDVELSESISGAAVFKDEDNRLRYIAIETNGKGIEFGVSAEGGLASKAVPTSIPGLTNCTSLAWLGNRLYAADDGMLKTFQRLEGAWKQATQGRRFSKSIYIHSDGKRLALSDTESGVINLFDSQLELIASKHEIMAPTHIAVAGDRVVAYESKRQRVIKLDVVSDRPTQAPSQKTEIATRGPNGFADDDYLDTGRPGGIPIAVALSESAKGLAVSIKTTASGMKAGVANDAHAFILSGGAHFRLPAGDWSAIRLAVAVEQQGQKERVGFCDHGAIHEPFSDNPATWAPFDLNAYRDRVSERKQQIRIKFDQAKEGKATIVIEDKDGLRIRNLVSGRSFGEGQHTVTWDGLDEKGKLVRPGHYQWRGITHPGIKPRYRMNFANGGEETIHPWGPNHGVLHDATTNGELIFFAAPVTEGGWALLSLDTDGRFVQGYDHQQGFGIGHNAIAADDKYLYCAQDGFGWSGRRGIDFGSSTWKATWNLTVARYDIKTGKVVPYPGGKRAFIADTMDIGPGAGHPDLNNFNLGGLAVFDGRLYVGSRDKKAVLVFDADTGEKRESIELDGVRHLEASDGVLAVVDAGVVRLRDRKLIVPAGDMDISGIAVSGNGDIFLSDLQSHQVHRFGPDGRRVTAIGRPGGAYAGAYDADRMVNPAGLAIGPGGKLWVTEKRWVPKRVTAWDLEKNRVVYQKFGMPHYGGSGSGFDPNNPSRWIGLGCLWDVNIASGTAEPTHILSLDEAHFEHYHPMSYSFFREAGRTFLAARGKIALISEVLPDGTIRDMAASCGIHHFAYGCGWKPPQAYIDAFYEKWPSKRAREKQGARGQGKPWSERAGGVLWVDRNADGKPQKEEFDFTDEHVKFADGAWGHLQDSLTFRIPAVVDGQTKVISLKPAGFLPNGVPDYPTLAEAIAVGTDVNLSPGYKRNGVATARDRFGRFIFNSGPEMNAYGHDGRHLWTYPNKWSDVHGSHDAPLPETGVLQGALGILGMASFDKESDVFFMNGNHGRCYILTSDGLYLDEVFADVRVSYLKNEYRLGGEIFGGMFDRSSTDGAYYVQIGHGPYRIYELEGMSQAKRMSGTIKVSADQIAASERKLLRRKAEKKAEKSFTIPGEINWDQAGKFKVKLTARIEDENLHLNWRVEDLSPWINNGRDWTTLFAAGDTVDLQLGADPKADPKRRGPAVGDKRLMIAPYDGEPIAVLYEHRKPGGQNPVSFTSPWRGEKVDDVTRLKDVEIKVEQNDRGYYVVEAVIPLATLGLTVSDESIRADFGVTFGDAEGKETQLRSYWSNPATMLVDDIPGEIMLHPNLWGDVQIAE